MTKLTHTVLTPPATDIETLLGCYRNVFEALEISHQIPIPVATNMTHPIPESEETLRSSFFNTMVEMRSLVFEYPKLEVANALIRPNSIVFVLNTNEISGED